MLKWSALVWSGLPWSGLPWSGLEVDLVHLDLSRALRPISGWLSPFDGLLRAPYGANKCLILIIIRLALLLELTIPPSY